MKQRYTVEGKKTVVLSHCSVHLFKSPTNYEGLFGLCSMFVVPGWAASGVDGSFGGA